MGRFFWRKQLLRSRPSKKFLPQYFKFWLEQVTAEFKSKSHSLGLQNVTSIDTLKLIKISVSDTLEEQQIIFDEVKVFINKIEGFKREIDNIKKE